MPALFANSPMVPRQGPPRGPNGPRPRGELTWLRRLMGLALGLGVLGAAVAALVIWNLWRAASVDLPTLEGLRHYQPRVMSRIYAGDDELIAELASERRIFVPLTAMPPLVRQAFISAEDQKFYSHRGIDPAAIARAAISDLEQMGQGRRPKGASTITQQVAKNMLLNSNNAVSISRKIREAVLAIKIEETLSKDRILELYLNEIYLGLGAYGVAAAAQTYFNKDLDQLTIAQCAFLGALPKAPSNYNPFVHMEAAKGRRDWVIDRMRGDGAITAEQARAAHAEAIEPTPFRRADQVPGAEWFGEEARRQLLDKFGNDALTAGLTVQTSLAPPLQEAADRVLREGLMRYDRAHGGWRGPVTHLESGPALQVGWPASLARVAHPPGMLDAWRLAVVLDVGARAARIGWLEPVPGRPIADATPRGGELSIGELGWARRARGAMIYGSAPRRMADVARPGDVVMIEPREGSDRAMLRQIPRVQGAIVSVEPHSGRVLAISGGWRFEASQFDRVTQAQRQPGSAFKPIVYLAAMEAGISPSAEFSNAPFEQYIPGQGVWRPNNYEMTYGGPTPLQTALEESLNLVTIRLAQRLTMTQVANTAIAFHVVDAMPHVLPAALGAVDTTVMRMAGAYASLAAGGREVIPSLIDSIEDRDGHVIYRSPALACRDCASPEAQPVVVDNRLPIADPASAFQVTTMMQGVVNRGTGVEAGRGLGRAIAGKTGTTQDFKDAWFAGFTPDLATVVWIGFDQPASLGEKQTGGVLAAPLWRDFMAVALRGRPSLQFRMPEGLTMASWSTGRGMAVDAFKPGQTPGGAGNAPVSAAPPEDGEAEQAPGEATPPATSGLVPPASPLPPPVPVPPASGGGGASGGVDSGMGGLY